MSTLQMISVVGMAVLSVLLVTMALLWQEVPPRQGFRVPKKKKRPKGLWKFLFLPVVYAALAVLVLFLLSNEVLPLFYDGEAQPVFGQAEAQEEASEAEKEDGEDEKETVPDRIRLHAGREVTQTFCVDGEDFEGVSFSLTHLVDAKRELTGGVRLIVACETDETVLFDETRTWEQLRNDDAPRLFFGGERHGSADKTYSLTLTEMTGDAQGFALEAVQAPQDGTGAGVDGTESKLCAKVTVHRVCRELLWGFYGVCALIFVVTGVLYVLLFIKKVRIETVFLIMALTLGTLYCLLIPPQTTPDEGMHLDSTYRLSNAILGIDEPQDTDRMIKRADDTDTGFKKQVDHHVYQYVFSQLGDPAQDLSLVETDGLTDTKAGYIMYLPGVVTLTAMRLIGFGTVTAYMLSTWLCMVFFVMMAWIAMRHLPFGKCTLFLICVLPMTLQQAASFSYDCMINTCAILFTAFVLEAAYRVDRPVKVTSLIVILLTGLFTAFCKAGAYLPITLISVLIPVRRLRDKRKMAAGIAAFALFFILVWVYRNFAQVAGIGTAAEKTVYWSKTPGYTLSYLLQNPLRFATILVSTFLGKGGYYIETLVGRYLGWLSIDCGLWTVYGFLALLVLSTVCEEKELQPVSVGSKVWIGLMCLGSIGLILMSMLLSWTPMTFVTIEGVQGRYFLPILFFVLLLLRNKRICVRKSMDSGLIFGAWAVQLIALTTTLLSIA